MTAVALLGWAATVMLISVRLSVLFIATPVFAAVPLPVMVRVVLIVGLAAGFSQHESVAFLRMGDPLWLAVTVLHELIIGAVMALGLFAGFGAFHFGGRLLDSQVGFGIAGLFDIATRSSVPLLGSILTMVAVMLFFLMDGHLAMLRMLQLSFEKLPVGTGIGEVDFGAVAAYFGSCFVFGLSIVAPVVIALFLVDSGIALMSRTMPQMNVFVMSFVVKVLVGLTVLAIAIPFSAGLIRSVFDSIFGFWSGVLGG